MNEDTIRREIQHILAPLGYVYIHIPRNTWTQDGGQPDIWGIHGNRPSIAIEVKTFEARVNSGGAFQCRNIRDNQRAWLDWLTMHQHIPSYLAIGTLTRPRQLWILPWLEWVNLEHSLYSHNNSLIIRVEDLEGYDCEYCKLIWLDGKWTFRTTHPLCGPAEPFKQISIRDFSPVSLRLEDNGQNQRKPTHLS